MTDQAKVVVVEDDPGWQEFLKKLLERPPQSLQRILDTQGFRVVEAGDVERARQLIEEGIASGDPCEAILLDLGIPYSAETPPDPEHGLRFLSEVVDHFKLAAVVLSGDYFKFDSVLGAFRRGVMDFFSKPDMTSEAGKVDLVKRMVQAVGRTREALLLQLHLDRLRWLREHERRQWSENATRRASERASEVIDHLSQLSKLLTREYGIDPQREPDEPAHRRLELTREAVDGISQSLWDPNLGESEPAKLECVDVADELTKRINRLRPCYLHRDVQLHWTPSCPAECRTQSFKRDLELLLDELVVGLLESSCPGGGVKLSCRCADNATSIVVQAQQTSPAEPGATRLAGLQRHYEESAETGLQFIQRIAHNMGVRFCDEGGNENMTLTLQIPVIPWPAS